jgi:nucleoside-diphosphate-sugar epimerase
MLAEKLLLKKLKKSSIKLCIGRIFSFTDKKQKKPFVIPSIKHKLNNSKKKIIFKNINQFRDFLNIDDVISAIYILMKTSKVGIYNIGSGRKFDLRKIVKLFNKNNKDIIFKNTVRPTYLISNNNKLLKTKWRASKFKNDIKYFY